MLVMRGAKGVDARIALENIDFGSGGEDGRLLSGPEGDAGMVVVVIVHRRSIN